MRNSSYDDDPINEDHWYNKSKRYKPPHGQRKKWIAVGIVSLAFVIAIPMITYFSISLVELNKENDKSNSNSMKYSLTWSGPSSNDKKRTATDPIFSKEYVWKNWIHIDSSYIERYGAPKQNQIKIVGNVETGRLTTTIDFNEDATILYNNSQIYDHQIIFQSSGFYIGDVLNVNFDQAYITASQGDFIKSISAGHQESLVTVGGALDVLAKDNIKITDKNGVKIDSNNDSAIISIDGKMEGTYTTGDVVISIKHKINPSSDQEGIQEILIPENKFIPKK